jgi:type I restriction enzyme S subunit
MKWAEYALDELGQISRGRSRHRPRDAAHLYGGEHPFVQTGDVKHSGLYLRHYTKTYSEEGLLQSKKWPIGTLCITIAANIGDTAILDIEACFPDSVIGFIADPKIADTRFIKYLFDATVQEEYKKFTQGAAQDNLSQKKLLSLKLRVPPLPTQKRIADILSGYDDLIENNKRRMTLLESTARELYREWFVRLRFPGHEHCKLTNGIPAGWGRKKLGEVLTLKYGKALKADDRVEGEYPVYGSSGIVGSHEKAFVKGPTIILGRKGNVGSVFWSLVGIWPIDTVYFIGPEVASLLLYYQLQFTQFINTDVAVPGLNRNLAHSRELLVPSKSIQQLFNENVEPLHKQLTLLEQQNQKLRAARDLLLPKLMNGELEV